MLPWSLLLRTVRVYTPYIMLPFAATIGFIGYNIESNFRDPLPPQRPSIKEERNERLLNEILDSEKENLPYINKKFVPPKTIFDKNVSPSLDK